MCGLSARSAVPLSLCRFACPCACSCRSLAHRSFAISRLTVIRCRLHAHIIRRGPSPISRLVSCHCSVSWLKRRWLSISVNIYNCNFILRLDGIAAIERLPMEVWSSVKPFQSVAVPYSRIGCRMMPPLAARPLRHAVPIACHPLVSSWRVGRLRRPCLLASLPALMLSGFAACIRSRLLASSVPHRHGHRIAYPLPFPLACFVPPLRLLLFASPPRAFIVPPVAQPFVSGGGESSPCLLAVMRGAGGCGRGFSFSFVLVVSGCLAWCRSHLKTFPDNPLKTVKHIFFFLSPYPPPAHSLVPACLI